MAKAFTEDSGGALDIASEPGRGTTVTLWLPEAEAKPQPAREAPATRAVPSMASLAGRRILIVDDDEQVRESLMTTLQDAGFVTLDAEDAATALGRLDGSGGLDAVITDFSMPGLNGLDLIHAAHARLPGLPAILLTGYVGDVPADAVRSLQGKPFAVLLKPALPARVVEQLAELMAQAPRA
jgi:DNA-binding NtrC family response regulator